MIGEIWARRDNRILKLSLTKQCLTYHAESCTIILYGFYILMSSDTTDTSNSPSYEILKY